MMNTWGSTMWLLAEAVLDASVKSTAVLLLAWGMSSVMRRASAAARHLVWTIATTGVILLPVLSLLLPGWRAAVLPARANAVAPLSAQSGAAGTQSHGVDRADNAQPPRQQVRGLSGDHGPASKSHGEDGELAVGVTPSSSSLSSPSNLSTVSAPPPGVGYLTIWIGAAVAIWFCGAMGVAAIWMIALVAVRRLGRRARPETGGRLCGLVQQLAAEMRLSRPVRLLLSDSSAMPVTWGSLRPRILLAADAAQWPAAQLRAVLLHELAHILRWDCATQLPAQMACAVYWFNPLAWVALQRLRAEREHACDDIVLRHGAAADVYAEQLVLVARTLKSDRLTRMAAVAMARRSQLRGRVVAILDGSTNRSPLTRGILCAAVVLAAMGLVPLSALHLGVKQARAGAQTTQPAASAASTRPADVLDVLVVDAVSKQPLAGIRATPVSGCALAPELAANPGHVLLRLTDRSVPFKANISAEGHLEMTLLWRAPATRPPPGEYTLGLSRSARISGRVVDDAGEPVAGAQVQISSAQNGSTPHESGYSLKTVTTAQDGTWFDDEMTDDSTGSIGLAVWDPHYVMNSFYGFSQTRLAKLRDGKFTVTLRRGVAIAGTVLDPGGKPLADATVVCGLQTHHMPSQKTDAAGHFALTARRGDLVVITVTAPGCAPELRELTISDPMDDRKVDVSVQLSAGKTVHGRVIDSDGKPIAGASITTRLWRRYQTLDLSFTTGADGSFTWDTAPADAVSAGVFASGCLPLSVQLTPGHEAEYRLDFASHVHGSVTDAATGEAIEEFQLVKPMQMTAGQPIRWDQTNARPGLDGTFDYFQTSGPTAALRVQAKGYLPADSRVFATSERDVPLDFKLVRGGWLELTVLSPAGEPVKGGVAALMTEGQRVVIQNGTTLVPQGCLQSNISPQGKVEFPAQSGPFQLVVFGESGYLEVQSGALAKSTRVQLAQWGKLTGRLTVGGVGGAGQKIVVMSEPAGNQMGSRTAVRHAIEATTAADGTFAVDRVPPGRLRVVYAIEQPAGIITRMRVAQQSKSVEVLAGQTVDVALAGEAATQPASNGKQQNEQWLAAPADIAAPAVFAAPPPAGRPAAIPSVAAEGKIAGRVLDDAGQAVGGAHVVVDVFQNGRTFKQTVTTNPDGTWSCENIPAGCKSVDLGVWDLRYDNGPFISVSDTPVTKLQDGNFTLTLLRGFPIEGTVLGLDGKPAVGALVLPGPDRMPSNKIPSEKTDAAGHFTLAAKLGEEVVITFSYPGCANEIKHFTMPDEKYELTVQLTAGKTMSARVVDPKGKPIAGAVVYTDTWRGYRTLTAAFPCDAEGRFIWDEAPADTVYCNVQAPGFPMLQNVPFVFNHENVATLHPAVHVTGTVTDAQTGKPIEKFRIIPGDAPDATVQPSWDQMNWEAGSAGKIDFNERWTRPGYAVRIEADGYLPAESRFFKADEAEVKIEFKLARGKDIVAAVLTPSGAPANGAIALLAIPGQNALIMNGKDFIQQDVHTTADAAGTIHFPGQAGAFVVAVFSPDGYAVADSDALAKSNRMKLEPWGHITGRLLVAGRPAGKEIISISMQADAGQFDQKKPHVYQQLDATTAADGTFIFNRVPAGSMTVSHMLEKHDGVVILMTRAETKTIELRSGQTIDVALGGETATQPAVEGK